MATINSLPLGNGPKKSMSKYEPGSSGYGDDLIGC